MNCRQSAITIATAAIEPSVPALHEEGRVGLLPDFESYQDYGGNDPECTANAW